MQGPPGAGRPVAGPLHVYSAGLLRGRVRRILQLAGHPPRPGWPARDGRVGVWGRSPMAARGEWVAAHSEARIVRVEDAFLRSIRPGRAGGGAPLGLVIDEAGVHFDPSTPSDLETLLSRAPLDDAALLDRARDCAARLIAADLSKYNMHDTALPPPEPGYVLVVDQVRGDASLRHGGQDGGPLPESLFTEMLVHAQAENPGARVIIKTHPETVHGHRPGHYSPGDAGGRVSLLSAPVSPWRLLDGAVAVYTVSSQLGFEAIMAGHRPRVFGTPFYAGWGLTIDETPLPRRARKLTRTQLFAAAMMLYPTWYDPCRDRLCTLEDAIDQLEAETRAFREDRHGHVAIGMRLWKRAGLQRAFGRERRLVFENRAARALARARASGRGLLVWAGKEPDGLAGQADSAGVPLRRVEDGFLRSRGLGAALTPALSLVTDDLGIYYDPTRDCRLERLIEAGPPAGGAARAERLIAAITRAGLSKYNLDGETSPAFPPGRRILVPGQVEDDASIRLGAGAVRTNLDLLRRVRAEAPEAVILYKPHPDVEAGLRDGTVPADEARALADMVLDHADPAALLPHVDEVWTMTSLLGFEALLRGVAVSCLGAPFYAGWGLTRDLGPVPARRRARPTLQALAHAALIAYPRYIDPVTGRPCPAEVVAERLATGRLPRGGPLNRGLSKLQGLLASQAWLWR
ncbi:beta-3-deoxy-D-manno-oct-2-ulosonic acid transferase [Rhodobacteraceae bacterium WD3A24]|nr:beta-3-deoxy-D-manno-oct-2-ulosonic acid transferase [Rhodobacteraceae bacterium WD3A24]